MDSKTLKALQFFYARGPTPFLKLSNYLNEFSAEYRYLLATGMIERTHCGQMVEVTIAGRDAYERNNPSSKVNVISWIAITLQFLNMILSPHDYSMAFAYIGNARSGIFHYDGCQYVYRMKNSNKVYFDSREDAVDAGYRPCRVCRP